MAAVANTDFETKRQAMDKTLIQPPTKSGSAAVISGAKDKVAVPPTGLKQPDSFTRWEAPTDKKETAKEQWLREKQEAKWKPASTPSTTEPIDPADPWGLKKTSLLPSETEVQKPIEHDIPRIRAEYSEVSDEKHDVDEETEQTETPTSKWKIFLPIGLLLGALLLVS